MRNNTCVWFFFHMAFFKWWRLQQFTFPDCSLRLIADSLQKKSALREQWEMAALCEKGGGDKGWLEWGHGLWAAWGSLGRGGQGQKGLVVPSGHWHLVNDPKTVQILGFVISNSKRGKCCYDVTQCLHGAPTPQMAHVPSCFTAGKCPGAAEGNMCTTGMIRGMWQLPIWWQPRQDSFFIWKNKLLWVKFAETEACKTKNL